MKSIRILTLFTLVVTLLVSCKKDEDFPGLAGTWDMEWALGNTDPTNYERWELKADGSFKAYDDDGDLYAEGTFHVDGLNFTAEYTSVFDNDYSFEGLYHDGLNEVIGTWGRDDSTTDGGNYEMYKR
jgi:hypothetical protein